VTVSGDVAHQTLTLDLYLERAEPAPMTLFKLTHQHVCDVSFAYASGMSDKYMLHMLRFGQSSNATFYSKLDIISSFRITSHNKDTQTSESDLNIKLTRLWTNKKLLAGQRLHCWSDDLILQFNYLICITGFNSFTKILLNNELNWITNLKTITKIQQNKAKKISTATKIQHDY